MELAQKKRYMEPLVCEYTNRPFCIVLVFTYCPAQLPTALRAAPVRTTLTVLHAPHPGGGNGEGGGEGGGGGAGGEGGEGSGHGKSVAIPPDIVTPQKPTPRLQSSVSEQYLPALIAVLVQQHLAA